MRRVKRTGSTPRSFSASRSASRPRTLSAFSSRARLPERLHQGTDLLRTGTAAAAEDLEPFLPPAAGVGNKCVGRRYGRPVPLISQVLPPIRVRAKREGGVLPQPGRDAMDEARWQAIDEDGAGTHLLEAASSATEAVAIVKNGLTVDPDDLADRASV